jgi:hypothetical protein
VEEDQTSRSQKRRAQLGRFQRRAQIEESE